MDLKQLIKKALLEIKAEQDCGCGCKGTAKCFDAPILNENLKSRTMVTENMQYHIDNKKPLTENTFRYGSEAFLNLWAEARHLYSRNLLDVYGVDKELVTESNLGEYGIFEGKKVPLDMPMLDENQMLDGYEVDFFQTKANVYANIEIPSENPTFEDDIQIKGTGKTEEEAFDDLKQNYNNYKKTKINEAEYHGKKVQIGKPKRGGASGKKYYVYVKDKGKVKKVSFGDSTGLSAKINDSKARQAFAKRHDCANKKDKTKASYWSCRLPRYAKLLGLKSNFTGFW